MDIGPILSRAGRSSERLVLGQLLSSASLASLQTYLSGLLGRCDHFDGAACLLLLLRHAPGLARDSGEKLMSVLTKTFHRPGVSPELQGVVCQCLVQVIQNSVNSSDTGKAISSSTPSLVTTILSVVSGQQSVRLTSTCLTLLAVLMSRYSGSCGQLRPKIMEMLISHLDTVRSRGGRVQQLGRCFSLVCQVGGGGREGVEHSAHHNSLLASLVSTVHSGLNTLLAGIKELDTFVENVQHQLTSQTENKLATLDSIKSVKHQEVVKLEEFHRKLNSQLTQEPKSKLIKKSTELVRQIRELNQNPIDRFSPSQI